ncbi:signal peptidase I [Candidatus Woesearchaeota archaeon]|nr:signal peptidase I [Candidatus Woesearchaeota archaeon]
MFSKTVRRIWHFLWKEDSLLSWLVTIVLAFFLVKFAIYPVLGLLLGTPLPVVAVVSGSMEHNSQGFEIWWENNGKWYEKEGITKEEFKGYSFKNGFNKGDIIVLTGSKNIKRGEVIVYMKQEDTRTIPIIHRVVAKNPQTTKGDNNPSPDKERVSPENIVGKARLKVPFLGWVKISAVMALQKLGIGKGI